MTKEDAERLIDKMMSAREAMDYAIARQNIVAALAASEEGAPATTLRQEVERVLADVAEAIKWRKECGVPDSAIADFDTVSTWLTLALAGCYLDTCNKAAPAAPPPSETADRKDPK